MKEKQSSSRQSVLTSLLLVLAAIVTITVASRAWMSVSDNTRLRAVRLDVTTGYALRFDLYAHESFSDYARSLRYADIAQQILAQKGFDINTVPMEPVTTSDGETFWFEDGTAASPNSGAYWEFTLYFRSEKDMLVHLTSANSSSGQDGTAITSGASTLPDAMRISFTSAEGTVVYDPGGAEYTHYENYSAFSLPNSENMLYNEQNVLFNLPANENKAVIVRIWMEGTDPACEDSLKKADFGIRLRFEGTDEDNNTFAQNGSGN